MTQHEFNERILTMLIIAASNPAPDTDGHKKLWSGLTTLHNALPVDQSADDE